MKKSQFQFLVRKENPQNDQSEAPFLREVYLETNFYVAYLEV